jgi:RNA polymerase sigma-70 factor (ECF subfamily)
VVADRELVEAVRAGDRAAYEQLARAIAPRLFRVAYRIVHDRDAAEDVMQQALIAVWRDAPTLRDTDGFEAWTYRLVVHAATSEIRRDRRRRARVRVLRLDDGTDAAYDAAGPDELQLVHDRDALDRAFEALTPDHRAVVVLRHYSGLPIEAIAEALDIPFGTVASRLHYAMRSLRAALEAADRLGPREVHSA